MEGASGAALAPLFATADPERRWRGALWFSIAFVAVVAVITLPFIPDGGLREILPGGGLNGSDDSPITLHDGESHTFENVPASSGYGPDSRAAAPPPPPSASLRPADRRDRRGCASPRGP